MSRSVMVFGPAYFDRVLRVDQPLWDDPGAGPLDQSMTGAARFGPGPALQLFDPMGRAIEVALPDDWPGPRGRVGVDGTLADRAVRAAGWVDDLGGMGAGFAAALGGTLVHALGPPADPTSRRVEELLRRHRVEHHAIRIADRPADWTLLVSSGGHGDKLAVGFRGCHEAMRPEDVDPWLGLPCDLRVAAGLPNPVAARVLQAPGAGCRLFAPALRNVRDRACPLSSFAAAIDVLCCNRLEWETLDDREEVGWRVSILVVTDGPAGCWARFTGPTGETGTIRLPAFPRHRPPRDTNRAGEAFAATLVSDLLESGWQPTTGVVEEAILRGALVRASAAAALVLDRDTFGFPDGPAIDRALRAGRVG